MIVLFTMNLATAQQRPDKATSKQANMRSANQVAKLTKELSLTEDQVSDLEVIHASFAEQLKTARKNGSSKEVYKSLQTEKVAAIKEILNGEQLEQFEAMERNRKAHPNKQGRMGKPGKGTANRDQKHLERMTEKLDLSETQVAAIQEIQADHAVQLKALKESEEEVDRTALKALRTEKENAIKAQLTAEQLATYEEQFAMSKQKAGRGKKKGKKSSKSK